MSHMSIVEGIPIMMPVQLIQLLCKCIPLHCHCRHLRGASPCERKTLLVVKAACGRFPLVYEPRQARLISCQFASADVLSRYDIDNWMRHSKQ